MLENRLIEHCAPTLAGIKSANLFSCHFDSKEEVLLEIDALNKMLNDRGVVVEAVKWKENWVLIYVYRRNMLEKELRQDGAAELLFQYGYSDGDVEHCLEHLKERLYQYECFPHEIGIFLGYPLEDVKGFIAHKGKKCKYCGLWKVYCNEQETRKFFEKIQKCNRIYSQVFAAGRSLSQMTVAV